CSQIVTNQNRSVGFNLSQGIVKKIRLGAPSACQQPLRAEILEKDRQRCPVAKIHIEILDRVAGTVNRPTALESGYRASLPEVATQRRFQSCSQFSCSDHPVPGLNRGVIPRCRSVRAIWQEPCRNQESSRRSCAPPWRVARNRVSLPRWQ